LPAVERFEDLDAWKKARDFSRLIYRVSSQGEFRRDRALRDQMRRAAVSILSNIGEGFERGGNREFRQFLAQAKGSTGEVRAQLYVALDAGFLIPTQFQELHRAALDTSRLIAGLMRYLAQSELKGTKFRSVQGSGPASPLSFEL
jgi:four helix bundle protein